MRLSLLVTIFLGVSSLAAAKVPYDELDALRKNTIVVRTALDNPNQAWVKKCVPSVNKRAGAGEKLALATDNAAASWKKLSATAADLNDIAKKISFCEARGSCSVYEVYLGAVQIPPELAEKASGLRIHLEKKLEALTSSSYQKALSDIKQPCAVLKGLLK